MAVLLEIKQFLIICFNRPRYHMEKESTKVWITKKKMKGDDTY